METGFLHVQIYVRFDGVAGTQTEATASYELASLSDRRFASVAAAVNHCARIGIYSRFHPPVVLKYPLDDHTI